MANEETHNKTISNSDSGFPPYLDFDTLRTSSIDYLSGLTGKIWTDYNVHDPGITILEVLIYALLDLGYRTNLPAKDIFASNPNSTAKENNFFTPAEILACNPVTITDFRKLLIDIEGVKNAWLSIAEDATPDKDCPPPTPPIPSVNTAVTDGTTLPTCKSYINGLYQIQLELDDYVVRKQEDIISDVKDALSAHRNLCEDYLDISILSRLDLGVCADIELEAGADIEEVYKAIISNLQDYFAPGPKFYTLQQLLQKKSMEAIFAGRPYDLQHSHGFIDTDEFEMIVLKDAVHLSDIYNAILSVPGVKTVRKLRLTQDGKTFLNSWQFTIPDGYVMRFSTAISSMQFSANGIIIPLSIKEQTAFLKDVFNNTDKILQPQENLVTAMPTGIYHNDLAEYYSIQNDFPLVYGIGETGLPSSVLPSRKAKALQLKGYLLFFDHLLANYLSQLGNLRDMFSFKTPSTALGNHTYFLNKTTVIIENETREILNTVPGFTSLTQNTTDQVYAAGANKNGTILAHPVNKKDFLNMVNAGSFTSDEIQKLQQQYACESLNQYDVITALLVNDFKNELVQILPIFGTSDNHCFYAVATSSEAVVLTSNIFLNDPPTKESPEIKVFSKDAFEQVNLLLYIATLQESYNSYFSNGAFTFNVRLNHQIYMDYLQQVMEDKALYRTRRDGFLNHLLSRFAEQFSDFALLSYGFCKPGELADQTIANKEKFLTNYPLLSSTRGKAYNYYKDEPDNISGFEKRFKALTGINSGAGSSLCNFEVVAYENTYSIKLILADLSLFETTANYEGIDKAQAALQQLFTALSTPANYKMELILHEEKYQLQVQYNNEDTAYYTTLFSRHEDVEALSKNLQSMFNLAIREENTFVSNYEFRLQLTADTGKVIRLSANPFNNAEDAFAAAIALLRIPNDDKKWQLIEPAKNPSGKFCSNNKKKPEKLVDLEGFKIDINNNIVGKPDKYSYELLDKGNTFKFRALNEFDNEAQARTDCYRLLMLMVDINNYKIVPDGRRVKLYVNNNDQPLAECVARLDNEIRAIIFRDKIYSIVRNHFYILAAQPFPNKWKFNYQLALEKDPALQFISDETYDSSDAAVTAAQIFTTALPTVILEAQDKNYTLKMPDGGGSLTYTNASDATIPQTEVERLLALQQAVNIRLQSATPIPFETGIDIDAISQTGNFVYRLIDKDHVLAFYPGDAGAAQIKALYQAAVTGYPVLDICLGGDVTEAYTDTKINAVFYRYIIRCRQDIGPFKKDTILFKSVASFGSADAAEAAFKDNYLLLFNKASDPDNYGPDKYISLGLPKTTNDFIAKNMRFVFVPPEIIATIPNDPGAISTLLSEVVKSYPVKMIAKCSAEFNELFPANNCTPAIQNGDCESVTTPNYSYYFSLYDMPAKTTVWQSVRYYDTAVAARQAYHFFKLLLLYKGNYFIDKDVKGNPKIYLREVLAESAGRFTDEITAWGTSGIQQFICVAQSNNAFHGLSDQRKNSYAYQVACDNSTVVHPCKYDSPSERDVILEKLYSAFKNFNAENLFKIVKAKDGRELLYGMDNEPLAVLFKENKNIQVVECARIIELLQLATSDKNYVESDGKYSIVKVDKNNKQITIAQPYDATLTKQEWTKRLLQLGYYYPVKVADDKYCIEIRLPQFNDPVNPQSVPVWDCKGYSPVIAEDNCYLAWKSNCCYPSCDVAITQYKSIVELLGKYDNYRPFLDCTCYSYGISLLAAQDIIAASPQRYTTPDMLCEAIERSEKLLNSEGLILVEHLLLRPRTPNDCACKYSAPGNFFKETGCNELVWKETVMESGKPIEKNICFLPGEDPFSFIATIVLPAWPERFRKQENKDRLELILNREVPAHILLRILWLNPQEVCNFETLHKTWKLSLQKKDTSLDVTACALMEFLFKTPLNCLDDCTDCQPCVQSSVGLPCNDNTTNYSRTTDDNKRVENINELFGWTRFNCSRFGTTMPDNNVAPANVSLAAIASAVVAAAPEVVPEFKEMTPEEFALAQNKIRFFNGRIAKYNKAIAEIEKDENGGPVDATGKPVFAQKSLREKIDMVVINWTQTEDAAAKIQQQQLVKNLVWLYIDKILFEETGIANISLLAESLEKLRVANFDMQSLFNEWQTQNMAKYETADTINAIRQLLINQ